MVDIYDEPLELVPSRYDEWRERFESERQRIRDALTGRGLDGTVVRVEHVGSTAVPDLAAKDIVDLDIVVVDEAVTEVSQAIADELGGTRMENTDAWQPVFRCADAGLRFNDHVFAASSERWKISVATREGLRRYDDLRREYEALKRELAAESDGLTEYSIGKTAVIRRILDRLRADDAVEFEFSIPEVPDPTAGE